MVVAASLLSVAAGPHVEPAQAAGHNREPLVYAHRGYVDNKHTENTMQALNHARRAGARAVEVDMSLTADDQIVIMHDATLNRTTSCRGKVHEQTLAHIQGKCLGKANKERIPDVEAVVTWASRNDMNLILEIKKGNAWDKETITRLRDIIAAKSMMRDTVVHSFWKEPLLLAEEVDPGLRTQFIAADWDDAKGVRDEVDGVNLRVEELTRGRVDSMHEDGLYVIARDSENPSEWAKAERVGADGILTDSVAQAVRAHSQRRY